MLSHTRAYAHTPKLKKTCGRTRFLVCRKLDRRQRPHVVLRHITSRRYSQNASSTDLRSRVQCSAAGKRHHQALRRPYPPISTPAQALTSSRSSIPSLSMSDSSQMARKSSELAPVPCLNASAALAAASLP